MSQFLIYALSKCRKFQFYALQKCRKFWCFALWKCHKLWFHALSICTNYDFALCQCVVKSDFTFSPSRPIPISDSSHHQCVTNSDFSQNQCRTNVNILFCPLYILCHASIFRFLCSTKVSHILILHFIKVSQILIFHTVKVAKNGQYFVLAIGHPVSCIFIQSAKTCSGDPVSQTA